MLHDNGASNVTASLNTPQRHPHTRPGKAVVYGSFRSPTRIRTWTVRLTAGCSAVELSGNRRNTHGERIRTSFGSYPLPRSRGSPDTQAGIFLMGNRTPFSREPCTLRDQRKRIQIKALSEQQSGIQTPLRFLWCDGAQQALCAKTLACHQVYLRSLAMTQNTSFRKQDSNLQLPLVGAT